MRAGAATRRATSVALRAIGGAGQDEDLRGHGRAGALPVTTAAHERQRRRAAVRAHRRRLRPADLAHRHVLRGRSQPARGPHPADLPRRLAGAAQLARRCLAEDLHRPGRAEPLDLLRHQAGPPAAGRRDAGAARSRHAQSGRTGDRNRTNARCCSRRRAACRCRSAQVIILVLEGFTYPEIAEMLDIAPNALALRLSRAKAALKSMLERNE